MLLLFSLSQSVCVCLCVCMYAFASMNYVHVLCMYNYISAFMLISIQLGGLVVSISLLHFSTMEP